MDPDNASLLREFLEEYDFGLIPRLAYICERVLDDA